MRDEPIYAYMCLTDWDLHVPYDAHGCQIYFTEEDLIKSRPCVTEGGCGIAKIELKLVEIVKEDGF